MMLTSLLAQQIKKIEDVASGIESSLSDDETALEWIVELRSAARSLAHLSKISSQHLTSLRRVIESVEQQLL